MRPQSTSAKYPPPPQQPPWRRPQKDRSTNLHQNCKTNAIHRIQQPKLRNLEKKKKTPQRLTREHHNPVTTTAMQLLQKTGAPHLVETATAADNSLSYKKKLCIQQARGVG